MGSKDRVLNFLLYQVGWLGCVLGAAKGFPELAAQLGFLVVLLHLFWVTEREVEFRLVGISGLCGAVLGTLDQAIGGLVYAGTRVHPWAPLWVILLWVQLGMVLRGSLSWLQQSPVLAAIFGALGGPVAFLAGERLGAVSWQGDRLGTALWLGLTWGGVLPLLSGLAKRWGKGKPANYAPLGERCSGRRNTCQSGAPSGSERRASQP